MTVSVPGQLIYSYSGDGSTQIFSYPVRFLDDAELVVVLEASDGTQTVKTLTTHYTVSGAGEANGGSVTMLTAPAAGETLYIYRSTAATQSVDLADNNRSPAATVEEQLDRFAMGLQDLDQRLDRSVKKRIGSDFSGEIEIPEPASDKVIGWNTAGDALENKTLTDLGATRIITDDGLAGATDENVPSTSAAKTYADTKVAKAATDASTFGFVVDEDDMASDSATKLPTQQSVNQGKLQKVATRTALKALSGTTHPAVYLYESGREGVFKWDSSDLSTEVTADTEEGIYIAPSSDTTGASGAWVRQGDWFFNGMDVRWFGAVGDGSTDDTTALQAAIDVAALFNEGTLRFPPLTFLISDTLAVTKAMRLIGAGTGEDSTNTNGTGIFATTFKWSGATADPMITVKSDTASAYLWNGEIRGVNLNGNHVASHGVKASSVSGWRFDLEISRVTTAGLVLDDGNGVLSQFNEIERLHFIWGTAAAAHPAHGLMLDGDVSDLGTTQNHIGHITGLVYDGSLVVITNADNNVFDHVHGVTQSGGSGYAVDLRNGDTKGAQNNVFDYVSGDVHAASNTFGNRIKHLISEGASVTIDAGGQLHYEVVDYVNAELWRTHSFRMTDVLNIPAAALYVDTEFSGSAAYDPASLADGAGATTTVTATGCLVGDVAFASFNNDLQGVLLTAWVSATNTVSVRFQNETGATVDLASGVLRVRTKRITGGATTALALWPALSLQDGVTTPVTAIVPAPYDWNDGSITGIRVHYMQDSANTSASLRLRVRALTKKSGDPLSSPEEDESFTVTVNDTANRLGVADITFGTALAFTKGDDIAIRFERLGADALDTALGNMLLFGIGLIHEGAGPNSAGSGPFDIPPTGV